MCDEVWHDGQVKHVSEQYRLINYTQYMESKFSACNGAAFHEHSLYYKIDDQGQKTLISVYCYNPQTKAQNIIWKKKKSVQ